MDYIFVPIHDTAHWSLAVICHPGHLDPQKLQDAPDDRAWATANAAEQKALLSKPPRPSILHLDPIINGGHDHSHIGKSLRGWLRMEWRHNEEHKPGSIPAVAKQFRDTCRMQGIDIDHQNNVNWNSKDGLIQVVKTHKVSVSALTLTNTTL